MDSGPESFPLNIQPWTYGRQPSPPSKLTNTSVPTSGIIQVPQFFPPMSVAIRAQTSSLPPPVPADQGNVIFTRPIPPGSLMSVTKAGKTPSQRPPRPVDSRASTTCSMGLLAIMSSRGLAQSRPFGHEFGANALFRIKTVAYFNHVILSSEQRPKILQIHYRADLEVGLG